MLVRRDFGCGNPSGRLDEKTTFCGTKKLCTDNDDKLSAPIRVSVEYAARFLSHQPILENFVHHNPLKTLEDHSFRDALAEMQELEAYMAPGERVLHLTGVDPRLREQDALVDLCAVFLDRGASKWSPAFRERGFLYFFASLEGLGKATWRGHARQTATEILRQLGVSPSCDPVVAKKLSESIIQDNLESMGIPPDDWNRCLLAKLLLTKGWAGMFKRMEDHVSEAPVNARVSLTEYCAVQTILSRAAVETVAREAGWKRSNQTLASWLARAPTVRPIKPFQNVRDISVIAYADQSIHRTQELEASFEVGLLTAIGSEASPWVPAKSRPDLQFIACIDDRMCSIRRHLEEVDPDTKVETFGVAGFFGLPVTYKALDSHTTFGQAPDGAKTKGHVREVEDPKFPGQVKKYLSSRRIYGHLNALWERLSFSPLGSLLLSTLGPLTLGRLWLIGYSPLSLDYLRCKTIDRISPRPRTDLETQMPPDLAASQLASIFKSTGMLANLSPFIVVMGHGAASVNNPFSSAYNCGACAGNRGGVNARLFSLFANSSQVRKFLKDAHGIIIPDDTVFIGAEHNTTNDSVEFFDEEDVPSSHVTNLEQAKRLTNQALAKNALERCHRFFLADGVRTPGEALRHVRQRSVDLAEVRPELNHATNAAVVVGRRSLTRGRFLDRRAFLPSYDPFSDDDNGTQLEFVLVPALTVCSGISLEYFFSTIANDRYGAGTKAPLNVVANVGVQQGTYGDLRSGLPSQMVEMHPPVRPLFVIDSGPSRIQAVLDRRPALEEMIRNNWVHLIARDPDSGEYYRSVSGKFKKIASESVVQPGRQLSKERAWSDFEPHHEHGIAVKNAEDIVYGLATIGMLSAFAGPIWLLHGQPMMNPYGDAIAACATSLSLPVLAFSRRYLHGEFMFSRFSILSAGLVLGFNMVATAPNLENLIAGWGLFGFTSTFLIASYNDRPSVRNNATFAFAAYRVSDFALITALAFAGPHAVVEGYANPELVAGSLLLAALFKSSQFPLTALFARSMEGPTPTSALGYAGLSAHAGVVLLSSTLDLWFPYDWARAALAAVGGYTAMYGSLVSKIHADRKGALAYATSSTLGLIYTAMAAGHVELALALSMGHASFRTAQVLTAPDAIDNSKRLAGALGGPPFPRVVPDVLYRTSWALHRIDTDFHLVNLLHRLYSPLHVQLNLTPAQQWAAKAAGVIIAGVPFTPVAIGLDEILVHTLPTNPALAAGVMLSHYCLSVATMRFLFVSGLNSKRYRKM